VTIFIRLLSARPQTARTVARRLKLTATVAATVFAFAIAATPAAAIVKTVEVSPGNQTTVGLQKHSTTLGEPGAEPLAFSNELGNPVLHQSTTYAVYWDPYDLYHGDWQEVIDNFFTSVGAASGSLASVFAVDAQYTDKTNAPASYRDSFRGAYTDTKRYPAAGCTDPHPMGVGDAVTCLTDKQIREELESFITTHGLQKGMGMIYYVLTPPGVTVCLDGGASASHCSSNSASANSFCSYHSDINPGGLASGDASTILYAAIPWIAGGEGDPLLVVPQKSSVDCQDGGYDPSSKPTPEKPEEAKEKTKAEEKAFEEATVAEKEKLQKTAQLEGPHIQEPNQIPCPTVFDGGCDTGLADIIVNQIGTEQQNLITNPLLNAWQDPKSNEVTDECRNIFALVLGGSATAKEESGAGTLFNQTLAGGNYYLNDTFNLAAALLPYPGVGCLNHVNLTASFNLVTPVNAGDVVGLNGMQSNISLNAAARFSPAGTPEANYAKYTWDFGDGSTPVSGYAPGAPSCEVPWLTPCAASVFHSYTYGGTYPVTLTVTDVAGNVASVTHEITVVGPPPPPPPVPAPAPGTTGTPGAGGAGSSTVPNPLATAAIVSRSLKSAARKGLVVRYSVNEQVAGRFEVLIPRSVAKHLGITGPAATGLPAGSPPEIVASKAILITTKGGRSTVTIPFSKRTSGRLQHTHKLTVTLRLVVRNAAAHGSASTTVVTAATLVH
jgi:hypothetical protein